MRAHLAYAGYVARHKWFVLIGGLRTRTPLWRLVVHDWPKLTPAEWGPYVRQFYNRDGSKRDMRRPDGGYDLAEQPWEFKRAWLHHQRKTKHHWQCWVLLGDNGRTVALEMPEKFVREMVADWLGAGRAITGRWDVGSWYARNRDLMVLHPATRARVDALVASLLRPEEEGRMADYGCRVKRRRGRAAADRIEELERALRAIVSELGVPGDGYPAPVANAVEIASAVLARPPEQEGT